LPARSIPTIAFSSGTSARSRTSRALLDVDEVATALSDQTDYEHRWLIDPRTGQVAFWTVDSDGLHARTDGFTSLAVLLGVGGVALGWDWADPVVGLLVTVAIVAVLRQAGREIYRRLMDAVDPALVDQVGQTLRATPGVLGVGQVRLRWIGHRLRAGCEVIVDAGASAVQAHQVAVTAEHNLLHALPRLAAALVHADPQAQEGADHHTALASHR
jgi:cation diffusion facilitator family transporter